MFYQAEQDINIFICIAVQRRRPDIMPPTVSRNAADNLLKKPDEVKFMHLIKVVVGYSKERKRILKKLLIPKILA